MTRLLIVAAIVLSVTVSRAQNPARRLASMPADADPVFEAATIKPTQRTPDQGPVYNLRGRIFISAGTSLRDLIKFAYDVHASQILSAPAWTESDRYEIEATPAGEGMPNQRQIKTMLAKLLADRFQLVFHREQRELPAFVIVVAGGKPRLTPTQADPRSLPVAGMGPGLFYGVNATMTNFANALQGVATDRPVVDQTGLTGRYDFRLEWTPDPSQFGGRALPTGSPDRNSPALLTAIQEQLGLKLESRRATVDVLVIDRIDKPSQN
jgi:uncharacterized protein (TIGR03435 family)